MNYSAPLRDMQFVLHEVLDISNTLKLDGGDPIDAETVDQVLEAAGRFASEVIAPLNHTGDKEGCSMPEPGVVTLPTGFKSAYRQFAEAGWTSLACRIEHDGQGMPTTVDNAVGEIFSGANMGWSSYPGMSHAAYTCIAANGTQSQQDFYLPKIASGEWAGTMCLTEANAGTDLGALRSRATPLLDGGYAITGTKIFISGGEHDLTDNIIHLVLARLPDAPPGIKGISLFIVPKFLGSNVGELGKRNTVSCGSIEQKMGIHGNSTCTMNFEGAKGWLLGEPNKGMTAMFVMMNHARVMVGVNSIGLMSAAYQKALAYAKDRTQGRAPGAVRRNAAADPIIEHADVRRMLLTQKAYVEGARAYGLWASQLIDLQHQGSTEAIREEARTLIGFATPIVKAFSSDLSVECTSLAIQVYGGHGFIVESLVEQHLRDARIVPLYEGANGVQAMDLLGRKIASDGGEKFAHYLRVIETFAESKSDIEGLSEYTYKLLDLVDLVRRITDAICSRAQTDENAVGAAAAPFLRLIGHLSLAWMWARMVAVSVANRESTDAIYKSKIATARFYFERLLPEVEQLAVVIGANSSSISEVDNAWL